MHSGPFVWEVMLITYWFVYQYNAEGRHGREQSTVCHVVATKRWRVVLCSTPSVLGCFVISDVAS